LRSFAIGRGRLLSRRSAVIGLAAFFAPPIHAQPAPTGKAKQDAGELVELERPAVFEINTQTGTLKETVQNGQDLIWHRKGKSSDRRFQISSIAVAFLRSETGGQVKMTFSCTVSSLGHAAEAAKLNVIVRSKGGAAMYTWTFDIAVKCADKNQPHTPLVHDVPKDIAANVFTNVNTVEVAEHTEPNFPGINVQRCG
jgi:hypothetical protein